MSEERNSCKENTKTQIQRGKGKKDSAQPNWIEPVRVGWGQVKCRCKVHKGEISLRQPKKADRVIPREEIGGSEELVGDPWEDYKFRNEWGRANPWTEVR